SRLAFDGIMRMDADGRKQLVVLFRQADGAIDPGRAIAGPDGQHAGDPGSRSPIEHGIEILGELFVVEMAMGIGQRHLRRAPTGPSSRNPASTGGPPSRDAATIMPFDSIPRSFLGWRLATMTTLRPTIFSGAYCSAIPATMVRGSGSAISTLR